jgi:hypothetical protein
VARLPLVVFVMPPRRDPGVDALARAVPRRGARWATAEVLGGVKDGAPAVLLALLPPLPPSSAFTPDTTASSTSSGHHDGASLGGGC